MYSLGEDFTFNIDDNLEYFTTIGNIKIKDNEYIIAENEYGLKKAFLIDEDEEEIFLVDEDDEESIIDSFDRLVLEEENKEFLTLDDEYEYESKLIDSAGHDDDDDEVEFDGFIEEDTDIIDDDEDYDFDDILNEFFDDEDEEL